MGRNQIRRWFSNRESLWPRQFNFWKCLYFLWACESTFICLSEHNYELDSFCYYYSFDDGSWSDDGTRLWSKLFLNFSANLNTRWVFPFKGVGVVIWYRSIPPHNNSRVVVRNMRILVYRSSLRRTITHLKVNLVTSHHQVVSLF